MCGSQTVAHAFHTKSATIQNGGRFLKALLGRLTAATSMYRPVQLTVPCIATGRASYPKTACLHAISTLNSLIHLLDGRGLRRMHESMRVHVLVTSKFQMGGISLQTRVIHHHPAFLCHIAVFVIIWLSGGVQMSGALLLSQVQRLQY